MARFLPATLLTLLVLVAPARAADQATGYVYHDQNRNEQRDQGEEGISGVAVSNGKDVVSTDQQGRYRLPVDDYTTLFVIKPPGWRSPVSEFNAPQFYYLHRPTGSPELSYDGSDPTGALPASIDFPLLPQAKPERFRVLVFGDMQPRSLTELDYVASDIVEELVGVEDVAFGITLGDIVHNDLHLFHKVNASLAQIGVPWYFVLGNHDMNFDASTDLMSDETFESVYGPSTYAFAYGKVNFIVLDNVISIPEAEDRYYEAGLRDDQLAFVENYLSHVPADEFVVLSMHIPLGRLPGSDKEKLFDVLANYPNTLSLSAHTHVQGHQFFGQGEGWHQPQPHHHYNVGTTSGSWWRGMKGETGIPHSMMRDGTPNGYAFVTFDEDAYEIDYQVAGKAKNYKMNIWSNTSYWEGEDEQPLLLVNVFNGNGRTEVSYRLKGRSGWTQMKKVEKTDPYYAALYRRWQHFEELGLIDAWRDLEGSEVPPRSLPKPQKSSHLWRSTLPTDLPSGRYLIEVQVTDMFGRTFSSHHTFRVAE